jgi:hypothetical protein
MKKFIYIVLASFFMLAVTGCGGGGSKGVDEKEKKLAEYEKQFRKNTTPKNLRLQPNSMLFTLDGLKKALDEDNKTAFDDKTNQMIINQFKSNLEGKIANNKEFKIAQDMPILLMVDGSKILNDARIPVNLKDELEKAALSVTGDNIDGIVNKDFASKVEAKSKVDDENDEVEYCAMLGDFNPPIMILDTPPFKAHEEIGRGKFYDVQTWRQDFSKVAKEELGI